MMTAPAVSAPPSSRAQFRQVETAFGPLDVREEHVLRFERGLLGFAGCHEWILLGSDRANTAWLQSADHPSLALLLVDPFVAFEGFSVDVSPTALRDLRAGPTDDVAVFAPVTLGASAADPATANLRGLVLINWGARTGVQSVIDGGPWSVREPVPAQVFT